MKKMMMTLAAVLCCAMTMTVFTACGSDDDDKPSDDNKRAKVGMIFDFQITDDMLKYCDIEISINNGAGQSDKKMVEASDIKDGLFTAKLSAPLPANLTLTRTVKMKADVDLTGVETIKYMRGYQYIAAYYNAAGQYLENDRHISYASLNLNPSSARVDKFEELVNNGSLDKTFSYTFDKNGDLVE
jgi:hypothetical protein